MARVIKAGETGEAAAPALRFADLADQARRVVLDARAQAASLTDQARAEAEQARTRAAEEGYAQGLAAARQETQQATAEAAESLRQAVESARELVEALQANRRELLAEARREMLEFAVELAERIVGRVAGADLSAAAANLAKALELCGARTEVAARVNPAQLHGLWRHCRELVDTLGAGQVQLVADESVSPGGVKLMVGAGEIDATIEAQLDAVVTALLGPRRAEARELTGHYVSHAARQSAGAADAAVDHGTV